MPVLSKVKSGIVMSRRKEEKLAEAAVERYTIRTPSVDKITMELSGGNQQKVILGRWTSELLNTDVLILDEPTKGIDVSTKAEIYQMICDFARDGKAVLFVSSELTEVLNVSDRIVVMHEGRVTGIVAREESTEESVLAMAMAG
jgi:ABC-type sugar transport system ATPase subunit